MAKKRKSSRRKKSKKSSSAIGKKWGGLRNAWKGYRIAHVQGDVKRQKKYAAIINKLQDDLGLKKTRTFKIKRTRSR
jgi:hypothetical protein